MTQNIEPSSWEKIEGMIERARDRVPSLSTGLLVATLVIGLAGGAWASKPIHRWQINKEWRARIAEKSDAVRVVLAKGDADADAVDAEIIATLGDIDARLSKAEHNLRNVKAGAGSACRISADGLR